MKRLWVAIGILAVIFAATLYNAYYLNYLTTELADILDRAEARAEADDWSSSRKLTQQAEEIWRNHTLYLHIALRHSDIDGIEIGFREVGEYLQLEENGEYSASNARLVAQIGLLYEAEQLSLKNVL